MTRERRYPLANITAQWWEGDFSRATMPGIEKLLLHTTETTTWPSYDAGAKAPTLTYNPWVPYAQRWRQHNWLNTSARALQDPTSTPVRENRDNVVQVEIIAYCNPASYAKYGHGVNALPDSAYEDLGGLLAFLHVQWGTPIARAPQWSTFPPPDSIRMTSAEYDAFKGVLGHQHASGNTHGDPGMTAAQVDRILAVARRLTGPTTPPPPPLTKDWFDMATPAEIETAVYNGALAALRQYGKDLFNDGHGTGDAIWDGARAHNQKTEELLGQIATNTASKAAG